MAPPPWRALTRPPADRRPRCPTSRSIRSREAAATWRPRTGGISASYTRRARARRLTPPAPMSARAFWAALLGRLARPLGGRTASEGSPPAAARGSGRRAAHHPPGILRVKMAGRSARRRPPRRGPSAEGPVGRHRARLEPARLPAAGRPVRPGDGGRTKGRATFPSAAAGRQCARTLARPYGEAYPLMTEANARTKRAAALIEREVVSPVYQCCIDGGAKASLQVLPTNASSIAVADMCRPRSGSRHDSPGGPTIRITVATAWFEGAEAILRRDPSRSRRSWQTWS